MALTVPLTGQRFGRWVVVARAENGLDNKARWLCRCDCGNQREVPAYYLRIGRSRSCGCLRVEVTTQNDLARAIHNMTGTPEYQAWINMKRRCYDPSATSYADYGGRGVTVCERWVVSFTDFYADMGRRPNRYYSLDRIDNNCNYEPTNCRWSLPDVQSNNQRGRVLKDALE